MKPNPCLLAYLKKYSGLSNKKTEEIHPIHWRDLLIEAVDELERLNRSQSCEAKLTAWSSTPCE